MSEETPMADPHAQFYYIAPDGKLNKVASVDEAMAMARSGGFVWFDYWRPQRQDLEALMQPLGLHPLAIEDCLDFDQIPKLENYPDSSFILLNAFDYGSGRLCIDEIDLFVGNSFVVTVSGHNSGDRWPLSGAERVVERALTRIKQGQDMLLHVIIDYIVDEKYRTVEALEDALDSAEETVLADPSQFRPAQLLDLRRDLLSLRKSLFHEREILVRICRKDSPFISEQAIFQFRDVYDHLAKFFELTEAYRDVVASLMEMYLSMINNEMAKTANETNATVRRLTLITTIFMPLTFLTGLGGMSEYSMMTGSENWRIAYPAFVLTMILIAVGNYVLLRWYDRRMKRQLLQPASK
jgi:magnesium transporter